MSSGDKRLAAISVVRQAPQWTMRPKTPLDLNSYAPGPGAYTSPKDNPRMKKPGAYSFGLNKKGLASQTGLVGPGTYSPEQALANLRNKHSSNVGSFGSTAKRGCGYVGNKYGKVDPAPGPGSYDYTATVGRGVPSYGLRGKLNGRIGSGTPGPGAYSPPPRSHELTSPTSIKRFIGVPEYGFPKSPRRFGVPSSTPGPGAYDAGNAESHTRKESPQYSMRAKGGGDKFASMHTQLAPGPGSYDDRYTLFPEPQSP